jgi:hypothetical protein
MTEHFSASAGRGTAMLKKTSLLGSSAAMPDTTSWAERESAPVKLGSNVEREISWKPSGSSCTGDSTLCIDCKIETQPEKAAHNYEQYIVTEEVWQAAGMSPGKIDPKSFVLKGGGGCLCVGCIERRLGRRLTNADFVWQQLMWERRDAGWFTPQLIDRLQTGMVDPRPIPEVLMIELQRGRSGPKFLRKAKHGEIDGNDVYLLLRKPGREPYAMHFIAGPRARQTIDTYYSDYAKFVKMVDDGTACLDLEAPEHEEDDADPDDAAAK